MTYRFASSASPKSNSAHNLCCYSAALGLLKVKVLRQNGLCFVIRKRAVVSTFMQILFQPP